MRQTITITGHFVLGAVIGVLAFIVLAGIPDALGWIDLNSFR